MDWGNIQVGEWWPLLLGLAALAAAAAIWYRRKGTLFPDIRLLAETAPAGGIIDRLPLILGVVIIALLILSMMDITTTRSTMVDKTARDFLVIVDTSRSMRENTQIMRDNHPTTFPRRAGLYSGQVDDPSTIPELGRYELARATTRRTRPATKPTRESLMLRQACL